MPEYKPRGKKSKPGSSVESERYRELLRDIFDRKILADLARSMAEYPNIKPGQNFDGYQ